MKSQLVYLFLFLPSLVFGGHVVTNCTEAALRAATTGGGTVTFACDGTITLSNTITNNVDVTLDSSGHQVTISGSNAVRVFLVSSNVTLRLINLTLANGVSAAGSAIWNQGGTVSATAVSFSGNTANGYYGGDAGYSDAGGGAIWNQGGTVDATAVTFSANIANGAYNATGGAVWNAAGQVNLRSCAFVGNQAVGATPWNPLAGYTGWGGAIYNGGTLAVERCSFITNSATGGGGSPLPKGWGEIGAWGYGGAVVNYGTLAVNATTFSGNRATGGSGGPGDDGFVNPFANAYPGGNGGGAYGGAIYCPGGGTLLNCTFVSNSVTGGSGGNGGNGVYGGGPSGTPGGGGGSRGSACGGAIWGSATLVNCSVAYGSATGGVGGRGGAGGGGGPAGSPGGTGSACGGGTSGATLMNTLLAANSPGNCSTNSDGGHNLSSDASCSFTNVGSMNSTDPNLGPLANNGGPTLTIALLPGSPAIDAADTLAAPFTDQRGFPRPAGSAADIGAFEYGSMLPVMSIAPPSGNVLSETVQGNPNQWCRLLVSSNLFDWLPIATNQIGPGGTITFQDSWNPGAACRFYRVVMP